MPVLIPMTTSFDLHIEAPPHPQPTSPPNSSHRFRPSLQKKYEEAQITFDKTLKGHYRHGKTGYDRVGALFLTWEDDDMRCKATEVDALREFFKDEFHYETDHYEIPSKRWKTSLNKRVSDFIYEYDSPDCLALLYYGGHAYVGEETGSFKLAGKVEADGDGDPTYFWNDISKTLRLGECDQLIITDCCFAARIFDSEHIGKGKFELLTSAGHDRLVPSPRMTNSFTKVLKEVLVELLGKSPEGFPTSRLYRDVYHKWTFRDAKPFLFDQSRYSHDKIWLRPQEKPKRDKDFSHGPGDSLLNLTLRLNGEPGNVMMNQLAMALQYLPNVDEVRFERLYAPRHQIEDFMHRIYQASKLRPLVRKLHAKRRLKKLRILASGQDAIESPSKFVHLLLEQKTHSTYDWSSATTDKQFNPSFIHRDRRKSSTWPSNRGTKRSNTISLSNRLFSIDYKLSIPDHRSIVSRLFPGRAQTIDCSNMSNGTISPSAPSPGHPQPAQQNQWSKYISEVDTWHIVMWFALIYVHVSMCFYMGD